MDIDAYYFQLPITYRTVGNFHVFRRQTVNAKLKLGETPTHRYFTCKAIGGCGFLTLKRNPRTAIRNAKIIVLQSCSNCMRYFTSEYTCYASDYVYINYNYKYYKNGYRICN